jgi:hypothetical protein
MYGSISVATQLYESRYKSNGLKFYWAISYFSIYWEIAKLLISWCCWATYVRLPGQRRGWAFLARADLVAPPQWPPCAVAGRRVSWRRIEAPSSSIGFSSISSSTLSVVGVSRRRSTLVIGTYGDVMISCPYASPRNNKSRRDRVQCPFQVRTELDWTWPNYLNEKIEHGPTIIKPTHGNHLAPAIRLFRWAQEG